MADVRVLALRALLIAPPNAGIRLSLTGQRFIGSCQSPSRERS
jgi:hypothetical protein